MKYFVLFMSCLMLISCKENEAVQGQGPMGPVGPQGPPGESIVGPKGDNGDRGPVGDRGLMGIKGDAGKDGQSIVGPAGASGKDGLTSLIRLDDIKDKSMCASGRGILIATGLDTNNSLKLEDSEIKQIKVLCEPECDCKDDCDKHDDDCDHKHEPKTPCNHKKRY